VEEVLPSVRITCADLLNPTSVHSTFCGGLPMACCVASSAYCCRRIATEGTYLHTFRFAVVSARHDFAALAHEIAATLERAPVMVDPPNAFGLKELVFAVPAIPYRVRLLAEDIRAELPPGEGVGPFAVRAEAWLECQNVDDAAAIAGLLTVHLAMRGRYSCVWCKASDGTVFTFVFSCVVLVGVLLVRAPR